MMVVTCVLSSHKHPNGGSWVAVRMSHFATRGCRKTKRSVSNQRRSPPRPEPGSGRRQPSSASSERRPSEAVEIEELREADVESDPGVLSDAVPTLRHPNRSPPPP